MDSLTLEVPKLDGTHEVDYLSTENTTALGSASAITEGTIVTSSVTLTLRTLAVNLQLQNKWIEYNISPQAETLIREHITKRVVEVEEDAFVNGDTDASSGNINNAYNASDHPHGYGSSNNEWLILFNGLRNSATGTAVDGGADAISMADFRTAIKNLGKYGKDPEKVTFIVSTDMRTALLGLAPLEKVNEYGPGATILTGEIGRVYGSRVIVTNKLPNTQDDTLTNTTGIRSSSLATNLYTEALAVYNDSPMLGVTTKPNRRFSIIKKDYPEFDRVHLFAIEDIAFNLAYPDAVVRIYGVTA